MKALSIRQPWAWLIAAGHKDIENRAWRTAYRGPLLIHASKGMTRQEYEDCMAFAIRAGLRSYFPRDQDLERGGIVGVADLISVDPPTNRTSPWHMDGCYGLHLCNARPLPFIAYKGQLGIFDVPDEIVRGAA
ncbi:MULTISPECIES: ASCH domain-containing protein [Burkholderia]|uniref:ASCH domain-containing protein n=1 Tax=Burkholderia aenigmatica TaxID=2015348 RepID=A0A6J5JKL4_9BURK|nr:MULTISPECIES: ASCH domain-containing protein [Burkholderia]CAB3972312.1 hypothetical protein BLA3211_06905 [Burkholderia aenigmatica]